METMGSRIKSLLNSKKMSQKSLAEKSGCTEAAISLYIKGTRIPRANVLSRIAMALDTTSDYLAEGIPSATADELAYAKKLISRNISHMSQEDRLELIRILLADDVLFQNFSGLLSGIEVQNKP